MIRSIVLVISCITISLFCAGQQKKPAYPIPSENVSTQIISFDSVTNISAYRFSFGSIEVRDVRPDSSKLGFYKFNRESRSSKYKFPAGTQEYLAGYLNKHFANNYTTGSTDKLLICIKKLWLSGFDTSEIVNRRAELDIERLHIKLEFYWSTGDTYFPVYRYDTIYITDRQNSKTTASLLRMAFLNGVTKGGWLDPEKIRLRPSVTSTQIDSFNTTYQLRPVYALPVPQKGVYVTYDEFKRNRPAYPDYEVKFDRTSDILYVQEADKKQYVKKDVWGICDGTNVFIRMGINFFPLIRQQHTWEFFGSNDLEVRVHKAPLLGEILAPRLTAFGTALANVKTTPLLATKKIKQLRPYQVDIETGKFY